MVVVGLNGSKMTDYKYSALMMQALNYMQVVYLTVIETAKMWGLQIKEYLAYVWREVMSGQTK